MHESFFVFHWACPLLLFLRPRSRRNPLPVSRDRRRHQQRLIARKLRIAGSRSSRASDRWRSSMPRSRIDAESSSERKSFFPTWRCSALHALPGNRCAAGAFARTPRSSSSSSLFSRQHRGWFDLVESNPLL